MDGIRERANHAAPTRQAVIQIDLTNERREECALFLARHELMLRMDRMDLSRI